MNARHIRIAGGLLLCAAAQQLCAQPSFTGIGDLGGNSNGSISQGFSPNGKFVAAECYWQLFYSETTSWSADEGMISITPGRASNTNGAINFDGSTLAGSFPGNSTVLAFRWTESNGIEMLGDLPGGIDRSSATAMSVRGDIIVGYSNSDRGNEAIRWTAETGMVSLGDLPGGSFSSTALAISADARVIVGAGTSAQGNEAMRWTAETGMVGLGDLPGGSFRSAAWGASADGSVVVGSSFDADSERAFLWTEQTGMVPLDPGLPRLSSQQAWGVSWDGSVVVGDMDYRQGPHGAYYWTATDGARWLADVLAEHGVTVPDGWSLLQAKAVSADGRTIAGYGINPDGVGEGFVACLGPACRADFNKDGQVNTADVIAYLDAWNQRSVFADWDYDGLVNTRDVIAFLAEWVAKPGC